MPSKREREYARRRYMKRAARIERARRQRRERWIAIVATLVGFGVLVGTFLVTRPDPVPDAATPTADAQEPDDASADDGTAPEPLPTTNPEMYDSPPPPTDALGQAWDVTISTNLGDITMVLDGDAAPQAVSNFLFLANEGFYDGTACHRLMPGALLQCGDPTATGSGGPGYTWGPIENAPEDGTYPAGTVAMARVGNDAESMGSQFFLVYSDVPLPDDEAGGYSVFGEITGGLDILQELDAGGVEPSSIGPDGTGRPATDVIITGVEVE